MVKSCEILIFLGFAKKGTPNHRLKKSDFFFHGRFYLEVHHLPQGKCWFGRFLEDGYLKPWLSPLITTNLRMIFGVPPWLGKPMEASILSHVQNPVLIPLYWVVDQDSPFLDSYNNYPIWWVVYGSIIPQLIINQQGCWTLLILVGWPPKHPNFGNFHTRHQNLGVPDYGNTNF